MELILIVLLIVILLGGGGWYWYGGAPAGPGFNPIGIIFLVILLLLVFGLLAPRVGLYRW